MWLLTWLPSGYGPTKKDKLLFSYFDTDGKFDNFSVRDGQRPPIIDAVCAAIEKHIDEHPDWEIGGHLISKDW